MKTKFTKAQLKEWTDALRSGRYKQGTSFLCSTAVAYEAPSFCCLGVLCDLHRDDLEVDKNSVESARLYDNEEQQLPQYLQDKFGISETGHLCRTSSKNLATLNDAGSTFDEIADIIEENFETVD